jgi:hypothetical protein
MVSRDPLIDVRDRLEQAIELAVAALKHQEQAGEEQLGVDATLAITRMQLLVHSSRLGRGAQQPEQKGRERGDQHQYSEAPDAVGAAALEALAEVLALHVAEALLKYPIEETSVEDFLTTSQSAPILGYKALLSLANWLDKRCETEAASRLESTSCCSTTAADCSAGATGETPAGASPGGGGASR